MGEQLRLLEPGDALADGPRALAVVAAQEALEMVRNPYAKNTKKSYRGAQKRWGAWCDMMEGTPEGDLQKAGPFPVHPGALVAHLQWLSRMGCSPNTVRTACTAICSIDVSLRVTPSNPHPLSVRKSPVVQRFLLRWKKDNPKKPRRQSQALDQDGVRCLVNALEPVHEAPTVRRCRSTGAKAQATAVRAVQEKAFVLVGFWGAFRVHEIADLDLCDVQLVPRGLEIHVGKGKTDQEGEGFTKCIYPCPERAVCVVQAWERWLSVRGTQEGPAFCRVLPSGELGPRLSKRTIERAIKAAAKRAGFGPRVSSHSLRASFITICKRAGKPGDDVTEHVGHASLETTRGYTRVEDAWERSPTLGLF